MRLLSSKKCTLECSAARVSFKLVLRERSQTEKTVCGVLPLIWHFRTDRTIGTEILAVIARAWGWGWTADRAQETFGNVLSLCVASYVTRCSCQNTYMEPLNVNVLTVKNEAGVLKRACTNSLSLPGPCALHIGLSLILPAAHQVPLCRLKGWPSPA